MSILDTSKENENVAFKLRYLSDPTHLEGITEIDFEWIDKMQEAFDRQGRLTPRQLEVLDNLWEKAS